MEGLAPSLAYCLELELFLESGHSVRSAMMKLSHESTLPLFNQAIELLATFDRGHDVTSITQGVRSPFDRALLEVLVRGLRGEPILAAIRILREEIERASTIELDHYMAKLPMLALVPLLLFLLPSFLILLFGPLFQLMSQGIA